MSLRPLVRTFPLVTLAFILVCAGFTGCAGGDMATVTISVSHPGFVKTHTPSFFDRMLAFLSFSTRVEAGPPPVDFSVDYLTITVSAPDFETITRDIPLDTGQLTLEVPAGNNRTFTLVAFNDHGDGYITRDYGGIVTTDLSPGANVTLPIQMGPLPYPPGTLNMLNVEGYTPPYYMEIGWESVSDAAGYYIYCRVGETGPFVKVGRVNGQSNTTYRHYITNPTIWHYFKISSFNENGEGEPTSNDNFGCHPQDC